ncbi:ribosome maturation factor RimM [Salisediminibacterium selenitireducens]|uniref:Ribosome maturation factor RimM n=1 Tax=Bacillus selenitireducens (strain ATCC 700615 / DSM 15326 / MLS10) TaxID=439292 RepID=D6XTU4_BACIE|nr:ribosome maturation factor RimM [Salisediminibacterium selenitireducens]ADH99230.1 16S rRNA processing protein RimM [[Bacillus] selenitireducens MLS10]
MSKWLNVGKIVNTHGIHGEVRVISRTDFKEERYAKGRELFLYNPEKDHRTSVTVVSWRQHKQFDLLTFEGYTNVNDVEGFRDHLLQVDGDDLDDPMEEDEFYYHEIIGLSVVDEQGIEIGRVKEILSPGANDVWVVQRQGKKDALIPYIDDVVLSVDLEDGVVHVRIPEGLIDE